MIVRDGLRQLLYLGMRGSGTLGIKRRLRTRVGAGWAAVLVFHRVSTSEPESGICVSPERFRGILDVVKRDYHVLSTDAFLGRIERSEAFTGREVLITFDDGYADNHELAAPILAEYGLPAIFFLTAGYIGTGKSFWWDRERGGESHMMTWEQARAIVDAGFDVGCHTMSHADLGREPISSWKRELVDARSLLQDRLGVTVKHFAYPFGGRENIRMDWLDRIRAAGFASSFCGFGGLATASDDRYWIPRMGAAHQRRLVDLRIDMDNAW